MSEQNSSANSYVSGYKYVPVFAPVHSHQGTAEQNELAYQQIHKNNMVKLDRFNNKGKDSTTSISNKNAISNNKNCAGGVNNTIIIKANEDAIVQGNNTKNIKNKNSINDDDPTRDVVNAE